MRIGITLNSTDNPWASGIAQSPYFLYDILKRGGFDCFFIVLSKIPKLARRHYRYVTITDAKDLHLDRLILTTLFSYTALSELTSRSSDCKCIYINFYNKISHDMDAGLGNHHAALPPGAPELHFLFDEIWIFSHHSPQTIFHNSNIKRMPYLWDSHFIHRGLEETQKKKIFYSPESPEALTMVSIFEPNISFSKNFLIPLALCEHAYSSLGVDLAGVNVFNCKNLRPLQSFKDLTRKLDLHKDKKIYFNNRWNILDALSKWGGCIVSHQMFNEPSYLHLECLYLGRPLIHNSPLLKDYGYFYEGLNIEDGAEQLKIAVNCHNKNFNYYNGKTRECLSAYSTYSSQNIEMYKNLLLSV